MVDEASRGKIISAIAQLSATSIGLVLDQKIENFIQDEDALLDRVRGKRSRPGAAGANGIRPDYTNSTWGRMLQDHRISDPSSKQGKLFRRRFRLPYFVFQYIVSQCKSKGLFPESMKQNDIAGRPTIPFELKLLGVLRMLGRNWCLDDVLEASEISETSMHRFFHEFCRVFVVNFWRDFVKRPEGEDLARVMDIFAKLGLPGCTGSLDCVHIKMNKCAVSLTNDCSGKEGFPTLVYQVVVDHTRRILSATNEFWGTINDKTIIRYDDYVMAVKEKRVWMDLKYTMLDSDGNETETTGM